MKLSIALGVATIAIVRAASWALEPHNVGPSEPKHEAVSDHTDEADMLHLAPGQFDQTIHMPALDVRANRPHSVFGKSRSAARWECGPMYPMVGAPGRPANDNYGRVSRCWTL